MFVLAAVCMMPGCCERPFSLFFSVLILMPGVYRVVSWIEMKCVAVRTT